MINIPPGICLTIEGPISPCYSLLLSCSHKLLSYMRLHTNCQEESKTHVFWCTLSVSLGALHLFPNCCVCSNGKPIPQSSEELSCLMQRNWGYSPGTSWPAWVWTSHCLASLIGCRPLIIPHDQDLGRGAKTNPNIASLLPFHLLWSYWSLLGAVS